MAIDKATRTLTLKGPEGNVMDVVAGDEVKNFDQIKLGDFVVVRYAQALTLELRKTKTGAGGVSVKEGGVRRSPASGRQWPVRSRSAQLPPSSVSIRRRARSRSRGRGQRRDAQCAKPRSVQGRQERRPG